MTFRVKFREIDNKITVKFTEEDKNFSVMFRDLQYCEVGSEIPFYDGNYDIVPKTDPQIMQTIGKRMSDNVKIKAIPFYEVSNKEFGETVYIGSEVKLWQ